MKITLGVLFSLLFTIATFGQSTTVSGTISDTPDGQAWFGGTYSFVFRVNPANPVGPYFWNGAPFSTSQTIAGNLDASGHYSASVPSNTAISPAGSSWDVTFCPLATAQCVTYQSTTVTGVTQTFAPSPPSIRINLAVPLQNPRAYTDAELVSGALGQSYYNIVDTQIHYCATFPCGWTVARGLINVTVAPTGACTPGATPQQVISTGVIYTCQGGAWAAVAGTASAAAPVNILQKNIGGVLGASNCSEPSATLNCLDNPHFRGPNLGVDVTVSPFNARPINHAIIPTPTATITGGANSAVVSSASGLQINDGFDIVGAGATQTMTTPTAPTVTPSCAASLTGLGFTVPAGAGSTAYQYQIAMIDQGRGWTAASTAGTTSTGNAALGANQMTITSIAAGATNTFTVTVNSTANIASGCLVQIRATSDDGEFGGWQIVQSVLNATQFTFTSGVDASRGISTTTATGGVANFWLCNHVVLPTPGTGGLQYLIYGRTSGSNVFLGMSLIANLGYTDSTYNTWDDYGATMMQSPPTPWWTPTTPPASSSPDMLVTTITNIVGTTLTLAANAGNSASGAQGRFDNAPNIAAAIAASNTFSSGGGGTIYFPPSIEGSNAVCYTVSSYLVMSVGVANVGGQLCLDDTIELSGNLYGDDASAIRLLTPAFGARPHTQVQIFGANPGIWLHDGGLNRLTLIDPFNGEVMVFHTGGNSTINEDLNITSGNGTNDYMTIQYYDYHSGAGSFGGFFKNLNADSGMAQTEGATATPLWASKFNFQWNFQYVLGSRRGFAFAPNPGGFAVTFDQGQEWQGGIMPLVTFIQPNPGNVGGFINVRNTWLDTMADPVVANLSPVGNHNIGAPLTLDGSNGPSGSGGGFAPLISGSPFLAGVSIRNFAGVTVNKNVGHNILTTISNTGNASFGTRIPSLSLTAINYTANHTLTNGEGSVNAQATLTFTIDTTLGDGQSWDVYSETGTTTLTVSAGTLHGNGATGNITIPNNSGMHVFLKAGNAYAYGLGGGGGGGCAPGGLTDALQYNGGGTCSFGGVNSPTVNGNYLVNYNVTAGAAVPPTITLPGVPVNPQTGTTYTEGSANTASDRGYLVTASNSGAQTYTMGNPSAAGFGFNYFNVLHNINTGAVTENASGFTVNGGSALLVPPSWVRFLWSDGVNYRAARVPDFGAFVNCTGAGNALQFTTSTGLFNCGSSSSGVASLTGDNGLFCNSASTGAVTLVPCTTTVAHKFWGNNTGGTAAASFVSIGEADLPATTVFTDKANVYGAFNQDFSAATWKFPSAAGATASATNTCTLDTTNKNIHCYINNADAIVASIASTPTNNDCAKWTVSSGNVQLADAGAPCGSGGGGGAGALAIAPNPQFAVLQPQLIYNTPSASVNANISATNMVALTNAIHQYKLEWVVSLTVAGASCSSGSTTFVLNAISTNPSGGGSVTTSLGTITLQTGAAQGTVGLIASGVTPILAAPGTPVQYSTTSFTAGTGCSPAPKYQVQATLLQEF